MLKTQVIWRRNEVNCCKSSQNWTNHRLVYYGSFTTHYSI